MRCYLLAGNEKFNINFFCKNLIFFQTAPGEYTITVKFADKHIDGSPFTAKITAP